MAKALSLSDHLSVEMVHLVSETSEIGCIHNSIFRNILSCYRSFFLTFANGKTYEGISAKIFCTHAINI